MAENPTVENPMEPVTCGCGNPGYPEYDNQCFECMKQQDAALIAMLGPRPCYRCARKVMKPQSLLRNSFKNIPEGVVSKGVLYCPDCSLEILGPDPEPQEQEGRDTTHHTMRQRCYGCDTRILGLTNRMPGCYRCIGHYSVTRIPFWDRPEPHPDLDAAETGRKIANAAAPPSFQNPSPCYICQEPVPPGVARTAYQEDGVPRHVACKVSHVPRTYAYLGSHQYLKVSPGTPLEEQKSCYCCGGPHTLDNPFLQHQEDDVCRFHYDCWLRYVACGVDWDSWDEHDILKITNQITNQGNRGFREAQEARWQTAQFQEQYTGLPMERLING